MSKTVYLILCFCLSNYISAQYYSKSHFGFKTGVNYSKFMPNELMKRYDDIGYVGKLGFYIGAFVNLELTEHVKIQPELLFTLQGSSFKNENLEFYDTDGFLITISDYKSNITEPTIAIPIMVQFFINDIFYVECGPQLAYIIETTEKVKQIPIENLDIDKQNSPFSNFDKFDFGASIGLGYKLSDALALSGRYFFSLISRNDTIKSSVFYLGIDYQI